MSDLTPTPTHFRPRFASPSARPICQAEEGRQAITDVPAEVTCPSCAAALALKQAVSYIVNPKTGEIMLRRVSSMYRLDGTPFAIPAEVETWGIVGFGGSLYEWQTADSQEPYRHDQTAVILTAVNSFTAGGSALYIQVWCKTYGGTPSQRRAYVSRNAARVASAKAGGIEW